MERKDASMQTGRRHASWLRSVWQILIVSLGAASPCAKAFAKNRVVEVSQESIEPIGIFYFHGLLQEVPGRLKPLPHHPSVAFVSIAGARAVASDTGGRFYLSLDYGQHWVETAVPWTGSIARLERISVEARVPLGRMPANQQSSERLPERQLAMGDATVQGTVHDVTGARVPGACVTLDRAAGGLAARQRTDRAGSFLVSGLAAGKYFLGVASQGFSSYRTTIVLAPSQAIVADVTLIVGINTTVIFVAGESVQAASPQAYGWIESQAFEVTLVGGERWTSPDGFWWSPELQGIEPQPSVPSDPPPDTCPVVNR